jgi:hypothetical protein
VLLVSKNDQGEEKIMMEWGSIVPFQEIVKYIAKINLKKYLKEVTF